VCDDGGAKVVAANSRESTRTCVLETADSASTAFSAAANVITRARCATSATSAASAVGSNRCCTPATDAGSAHR